MEEILKMEESKLKNKKYYHPKDIGYEKSIKEIYERLEKIKNQGN